MERIRRGKDFSVEWPVLTNGDPVPLVGRDLRLELHAPAHKSMDIPFEVEGIDVIVRIAPQYQPSLGTYRFTLWENYGKDGQTMVDSCEAFQLVDSTCKEGSSGCGCSSNIQAHHVKLTMGDMTFSPIVIDGGGGTAIEVDDELSTTSTNPVQNKVVTSAINDVRKVATDATDTAKQVSDDVDALEERVEGISAGGFVWQSVE